MAEAKKVVMTYDGLKKMEQELENLKTVRRKEVAEKIKEARGQGDLSETPNMTLRKKNRAKSKAVLYSWKTCCATRKSSMKMY